MDLSDANTLVLVSVTALRYANVPPTARPAESTIAAAVNVIFLQVVIIINPP